MRAIIFLTLLFSATDLAWAQSDFKLSTATMPNLEDALTELPAPIGEAVVRESLDSYQKKTPKADEVLKQIINALKTRQFAEALPKLEYLQGLRPTEPDLLILRGCLYAESGHPEVAEAIFKKAILIAPSHPWARLNLAEALVTQKKYSEAETTLWILSATRPESEVVRFKLIIALALQKKISSAEQELHFLKNNATTPAYYFAKAALAFANGDAKQGQDLVDQAKKIYGESQTSYFYASLATQNWLPKLP